MRKEIDEKTASGVAGGRYYINGNNHKLIFTSFPDDIFVFKNCSDYEAMEVMDSLIGKYSSQKEYDQACIDALKSRGWI